MILHLLLALVCARAFAADTFADSGETADEIAGPELLRNGTFDELGDGKLCPFVHWVGRSGQGGTYTFALSPGKSGHGASISGAKAGRGDIHNAEGFPVKAGEVLRVRFWARTENFKGGAFASLEGEPNNNGWHKINIDASGEWRLYESRVKVPLGAKGQEVPKILIWFYHSGTGELFIDGVSACVVVPDAAARSRREMALIRSWGEALTGASDVQKKLRVAIAEGGATPTAEAVIRARRAAYQSIGMHQGSDGSFAVGVATCLDRVFLDEPYRGTFAASLNIALARNESEGAQLVVISTGRELKGVSVSLDGVLAGPGGAVLSPDQIKIDRVGYVDTRDGKRPYESSKLGWWPDPLLPNAGFDVMPDESQPLLITVTTSAETAPGRYAGKLKVTCGAAKTSLPINVQVHPFALPTKGHLATLALGSSPQTVEKFYGGDPGEKIAERFAIEAAKRRMPPTALLSGWGWKTANVPKTGNGYDFTRLDRWINVLAPHLTRFPLAVVPRFRKFGGGDYDENFKREFAAFIKAYSTHLKAKGVFDAAVFYNVDEASNAEKLREWEVCKEMYALAKQAVPDLRVMQCLNEFKGVQALTGHADIWDLYFGQYEQAGGPARQKAGDEITLAVCIWPSEHPNLFIEYPLLDARIMPWICFRTGAKGFEYWDLFQSWDANTGNTTWFSPSSGTRTAWRLEKPHGDGLLIYPGPEGTPLSSLRLEALRDGIEDYEYLTLLAERTGPEALALIAEAKEKLTTGATSYDSDPRRLLELRARIARLLSEK